MRRLLTALAMLALTAAPALADVTVRYKVKDEPRKAITLSVADNGDARFDSADGTVLIMRDGARYFVASDSRGQVVGRVDDGIAIVTEFLTALKQMMDAAPAQHSSEQAQTPGGFAQLWALAAAPYAVHARGAETVGGRTGTIYVIAPEQPEAQGPSLEIVIASDADLAPVAREFRQLAALVSPSASALLGQTPDLLTVVDGLLAQGAPIRVGGHFQLDSVSADPIPASNFVLPGQPLTLPQLRERASFACMFAPCDRGPETSPDDE